MILPSLLRALKMCWKPQELGSRISLKQPSVRWKWQSWRFLERAGHQQLTLEGDQDENKHQKTCHECVLLQQNDRLLCYGQKGNLFALSLFSLEMAILQCCIKLKASVEGKRINPHFLFISYFWQHLNREVHFLSVSSKIHVKTSNKVLSSQGIVKRLDNVSASAQMS